MLSYIITFSLTALNLWAFVAFGVDKHKAKHSKWPTPESFLLTLAALGGSIGAVMGIKLWHHKTKHKKFQFLVPLFLFIHILLIAWYCDLI